MNRPLFKDIYELLHAVFNHNYFTQDLFIHYITGFSHEESFSGIDYTSFAYNCLSSRKNLRTIFGNQYLEMRKLNQALNLKDLIYAVSNNQSYVCKTMDIFHSKTDDILKLYKKHNISMPPYTDTEHLLLNLFTECIIEKPATLFASYKNQNLKPSTINSTFGRSEDSENLRSKLDQYHKIIISGQLGSGKSHFIKYCLSTWKLQDYCYINYDSNINGTLHKIEFKDDNDYKYFDFLFDKDLTDPQFSSSLLIIDNMYFSDNILDELEQLSRLPINVIVITIHNITAEFFHTFELPQLSDDALQKIFENFSTLSLQNKHIKNNLFCITQRNVCMISLIAGLCKKAALTRQKDSYDILPQVLSRLGILNNHIQPNLHNSDDTEYTPELASKFKVSYDKKNLDLIGHIKLIYAKISLYLDDNARELMKYLCCFGWTPIPYTFLKEILPSYDENVICALSRMKLLSLANETVQLPPLIAHAVVAAEIPTPSDYDILVNNLIQFLKEYDYTLSMPYLSDILFVFVRTLYDNIHAKDSKRPDTSKKRKDLLYMVHNYYNQIGDYVLAKDIIDLINCVNLKSAYNPIDLQLFCFSNELQMETTLKTLLPAQIDKICKNISNNNKLKNLIDVTNSLGNVLDVITGLYCTNFFLLIYGKNDLRGYQETLIRVMDDILAYITASPSDAKVSIDKEKLDYYKLCNNLMKNDFSKPDEISSHLFYIKKWENINYRIRGIAFILFMQNFYVYYLAYIDTYRRDPYFLPSLLETQIMPEMCCMSDLIRKCKLIPIQTFKLCYYSYISAAMIHYCFLSLDHIDKQHIPSLFNPDNIKALIDRTIISKEDLDTAMTYVEQISSLIDTKAG